MPRLGHSWGFLLSWCGTSRSDSRGLEPWEDCQVESTQTLCVCLCSVLLACVIVNHRGPGMFLFQSSAKHQRPPPQAEGAPVTEPTGCKMSDRDHSSDLFLKGRADQHFHSIEANY